LRRLRNFYSPKNNYYIYELHHLGNSFLDMRNCKLNLIKSYHQNKFDILYLMDRCKKSIYHHRVDTFLLMHRYRNLMGIFEGIAPDSSPKSKNLSILYSLNFDHHHILCMLFKIFYAKRFLITRVTGYTFVFYTILIIAEGTL